jgi:hypothetical protein
MNAQFLEAFLKPVLEVEFFILGAYRFDEFASLDGEDALLEHIKTCGVGISFHSRSSSLLCRALETVAEAM